MIELVDAWQNGEVELNEYRSDNGEKSWWLKIGLTVSRLDGVTMLQLLELINAFIQEGSP